VIVVSDTSPLHYLVLVGQMDVLPAIFGRVLCPVEVIAECLHRQATPALRAWASSSPAWLEVVDAPPWEQDDLLRLDAGEAAAIRLAHWRRATLVLMDERKGRLVAGRLGFTVAGVLSVLAAAAKDGLLDLDSAITRLTQETNFRASDRVIAMIRSRIQQP